MKKFLFLAFLTCLTGPASGESYQDERIWSGVNGKTFRGTFHRLQPDGATAEFFTGQGKLVVVAVSNLIAADQKLILDRGKKGSPTTEESPAAVGDPAAFKPEATPARAFLALDSKKFGAVEWQTMTDALWISFLWWDQAGVLEVPKKGGLERKAEWLYKELSRKLSGGTQKGIEDYFAENLKEVAACRITREQKDLNVVRLGALCSGSKAVILNMTMTYSNGRDFSVSTALESLGGDGAFVFHVFGKRFAGTAKAVAPDEKNKDAAGRIEFVLTNRQDLPAYYAGNEARFFLKTAGGDDVWVIKPYIYAMPGKPSPLPPEQENGSTEREPERPPTPSVE